MCESPSWVVGDGRTNSEQQNGMAEEETLIREATDAIYRHEGGAPQGWMSPGAHPSARAEDLLAGAGNGYTLDWPMDDQPVWMRTRGGPLLRVPYRHEVNDVPMVVLQDGTARAFADMTIDNFDEMLRHLSGSPRVWDHVEPGSFILGDEDGALVVPSSLVDEVLTEAERLTQTEGGIRAELSRGLPLSDALAKYGHV
jgi:hypothetical protein